MNGYTRHPASYRDPSGFIFQKEGTIYRQVNKIYEKPYQHLVKSGLYSILTTKKILIPHQELADNLLNHPDCYITLLPEHIQRISYPYEWCFDQLKDTALLTLTVLKIAVENGMILKDATPFNIQFHKGSPVFIDSLSFELYDETKPWIAYRQFCETFLYPLLLAHYHKQHFNQLLFVYPEGIPADLTARLLPWKSLLNLGVWLHVQLPAKLDRKQRKSENESRFSKKKLIHLVSHLENIITKLDNRKKSSWSQYYDEQILSNDYLAEKEKLVHEYLNQVEGKLILDLGTNEGYFPISLPEGRFEVIAADHDEQCINKLYRKTKTLKKKNILPLCVDITNPSPALGFAGRERNSFTERMKPDIIFAFALIHHLVLGKNILLKSLAEFLTSMSPQLIIEFIPKDDEKARLLLMNKKDIYENYTKDEFENTFQEFYMITRSALIGNTGRWLYLMKRKTLS